MTTITIYKSDKGNYKGFTCKGHAGYALSGYIDCRFQNEAGEHANLLIDSMILGLESIVEQCGKKYLRLKFEEV